MNAIRSQKILGFKSLDSKETLADSLREPLHKEAAFEIFQTEGYRESL